MTNGTIHVMNHPKLLFRTQIPPGFHQKHMRHLANGFVPHSQVDRPCINPETS